MQAIRPVPAATAVLLFVLTGMFAWFGMSSTVHSNCGMRIYATALGGVGVCLLLLALRVPCRQGDARHMMMRSVCFALVILVSLCFWYIVWATRTCNENAPLADQFQSR